MGLALTMSCIPTITIKVLSSGLMRCIHPKRSVNFRLAKYLMLKTTSSINHIYITEQDSTSNCRVRSAKRSELEGAFYEWHQMIEKRDVAVIRGIWYTLVSH